MRHRLQHKLFDRKKRSKSRSPSTFINLLHSKSTYFYRWESKHLSRLSYVIPSVCGLALVLVLGFAVFPTIDGNARSVYAESSIAPMSVSPDSEANISLIMGASSGEFNPADTTATNVTADEVTFRPYKFQVRYAETSQYAVQLNSMNGYGNELRGKDNPTAIINGVGENKKPNEFGNNTWGFAMARNSINGNTTGSTEDNLASADYTQYKYNTVPEYSAQTGQNTKIVNVPVNPDNNQTEAQTDDWTLAFAAKIGSDSPADHYISKVYLSVVRTPGRVYTVTYNANKPAGASASEAVIGTPAQVKFVDTGNAEVFKLSASELKLKKYKFMGWSTTQHEAFAKENKDAIKQAVQYSAGDEITFPSVTDTSVTLYAVWMEGSGLLGINTMQEMTAEVCAESELHDTTQLEDVRDRTGGVGTGKKYWVAKLADGNCWMTQNLDLDIYTTQTFTPQDTNIKANWTPDYNMVSGEVASNWVIEKKSVVYDSGDFVYTTPGTSGSCSSNNMTLAQCSGWKDISGWTAFSTSDTEVVIDESNKKYDAHYHSGNYYNWFAATAGSGVYITNQDNKNGKTADESICAKGWKLPLSGQNTSGSSYNSTSGSYYYLLEKYGLASKITNTVAGVSYDIRKAPLYFTPGGWIYFFNSSYYFQDTSSGGYFSSSVASTGPGTYGLYVLRFTSSSTQPSFETNNSVRYQGIPIRCVHDPAITE